MPLYLRARGLAKQLLTGAGLSVARRRPVRDIHLQLAVKMREGGVDTLLDVGANTGQFAREIRAEGYRGLIVSFEPLAEAHAALVAAANADPRWRPAPPMALGDNSGTATINVSHNLASSSLLEVEPRSTEAAPESGFAGRETVRVEPLDAVVDPAWPAPIALKLDTQGFEMRVLDGAAATLPRVALMLVEMSLVPLYRGGAGFAELFTRLEREGYRCIGMAQGFANDRTHELLQVDGLFARA